VFAERLNLLKGIKEKRNEIIEMVADPTLLSNHPLSGLVEEAIKTCEEKLASDAKLMLKRVIKIENQSSITINLPLCEAVLRNPIYYQESKQAPEELILLLKEMNKLLVDFFYSEKEIEIKETEEEREIILTKREGKETLSENIRKFETIYNFNKTIKESVLSNILENDYKDKARDSYNDFDKQILKAFSEIIFDFIKDQKEDVLRAVSSIEKNCKRTIY